MNTAPKRRLMHAILYTSAFWLLAASFSVHYAMFIMRVQVSIPEAAPAIHSAADTSRQHVASVDLDDCDLWERATA